jgi:large subunit ribosomal protein L23
MLNKPLITEKSLTDAALGKYTFKVNKTLTKTKIARYIEDNFGVKVRSVHTQSMHGKTYRSRKGTERQTDWKKAIVQLTKGQKIDLFDIKKS